MVGTGPVQSGESFSAVWRSCSSRRVTACVSTGGKLTYVHSAQAAWAHAQNMLVSPSVPWPWPLKQAWLSGRVLPAAYATLATLSACYLSTYQLL